MKPCRLAFCKGRVEGIFHQTVGDSLCKYQDCMANVKPFGKIPIVGVIQKAYRFGKTHRPMALFPEI